MQKIAFLFREGFGKSNYFYGNNNLSAMGNTVAYDSKKKNSDKTLLLDEYEELDKGIPRSCGKIPNGALNSIFKGVDWSTPYNNDTYERFVKSIEEYPGEFVIKHSINNTTFCTILFVKTKQGERGWTFFLK